MRRPAVVSPFEGAADLDGVIQGDAEILADVLVELGQLGQNVRMIRGQFQETAEVFFEGSVPLEPLEQAHELQTGVHRRGSGGKLTAGGVEQGEGLVHRPALHAGAGQRIAIEGGAGIRREGIHFRRQDSQGKDILEIVVEDLPHPPVIPPPKELEIGLGALRAGNVPHPFHVQKGFLDGLQPEIGEAPLVEAPPHVVEVQVATDGQRALDAEHEHSVLQPVAVEVLSEVAHHGAESGHAVVERRDHGRFLVEVPHEVLLDAKAIFVNEADPGHEDVNAGSPG